MTPQESASSHRRNMRTNPGVTRTKSKFLLAIPRRHATISPSTSG
jgi:hypothetical protein